MKLAIVGDLHHDIKNGSYNALCYQKRFFYEYLIPALPSVDGVIFLGDIFHNRRDINLRILKEVIQIFKDIQFKNKPLYGVLGNHDFYFRNSYELSTVREIGLGIQYGDYNCKWYMINEHCICIHWHNTSEELKQTFEEIKNSGLNKNIHYVFGHFSLYGFNFNYKAINDNEDDLTSEVFNSYFPNLRKVFSGHFHTPSMKGKIIYVGVPYHLTWSELNEKLGFYILDSDTDKYGFIQNVHKAFELIRIEENTQPNDILSTVEKTNYRKLYKIVYNDSSKEVLARYIYNQIMMLGHDAQLVDENIFTLDLDEDFVPSDETINIETLIKEYFMKNCNIAEEEKEYYYSLFKSIYDSVKNQLDTIEIE